MKVTNKAVKARAKEPIGGQVNVANDNMPQYNGAPITFISMFSGIEAASVAFPKWKPIAFAEIDKFPCGVLAHHYPHVPNVGDMSTHDWAQYASKVDVVCGGPPCQDFSVAGLRAGMDGERGNLSLVYMRALHAIKPRNAIVENVPGWLSDKKNAFGCFLAGLVGADDAVIPSHKPSDGKSNNHWSWHKGGRHAVRDDEGEKTGEYITVPAGHSLKWPNSGMVAGPKGRAAWTILDAQYFGLAQRRKRVIVIADFGNGADPAAVLFERFGVQRNPPARGKAGEGVAGTVSARTKGGGGLGTDFDLAGGLQVVNDNVATFDRQSNCEYGNADIASSVMARDYKSPTDLVAHCLAGNMLNRAAENGPMGSGISNDVSFTLTKNDVHAVCITGAQCVTGDVTHALKAEGADASEDGTGRGNPIVAQTVALRGREGGATAELGGEVATALRASGGGGDKAHVLAFDTYNQSADYVAHTLRKQSGDGIPATMTQSAVRRLTPVECERLMGFPDDYTNIPWRSKSTSPDGPRYKALGNSWPTTVFEWIGDRITRLMPEREAA